MGGGWGRTAVGRDGGRRGGTNTERKGKDRNRKTVARQWGGREIIIIMIKKARFDIGTSS